MCTAGCLPAGQKVSPIWFSELSPNPNTIYCKLPNSLLTDPMAFNLRFEILYSDEMLSSMNSSPVDGHRQNEISNERFRGCLYISGRTIIQIVTLIVFHELINFIPYLLFQVFIICCAILFSFSFPFKWFTFVNCKHIRTTSYSSIDV